MKRLFAMKDLRVPARCRGQAVEPRRSCTRPLKRGHVHVKDVYSVAFHKVDALLSAWAYNTATGVVESDLIASLGQCGDGKQGSCNVADLEGYAAFVPLAGAEGDRNLSEVGDDIPIRGRVFDLLPGSFPFFNSVVGE